VRLTRDGALDASFASRGIAATGIQRSCGACDPALLAPMGLAPDGTIVVAGNTGADGNPSTLHAVVARLTPAGAPDASFGGDGTVQLAGERGVAAAVSSAGRILVVVDDTLLVALTPAGAADPSFNSGAPFELPFYEFGGDRLHLRPDGSIGLLGIHLFRFTAAGALDPSFGTGGIARGPFLDGNTPRMQPLPDGSTLVYAPAERGDEPVMQVRHVSAGGVLGARAILSSVLGGGLVSGRKLTQNSFMPSQLLRRPDGSFLVVGAVHVLGRGHVGTGLLAAVAYTPALQPDLSFGGPRKPARASLRVPRQTTLSARKLGAVRVRLTASGPGLALIRVRDGHRRVLARSIVPVYRAGTSTVKVRIEWSGLRTLRARPELRVQVGYEFRDLFTETDEGAVIARLG
jgi:uncharacterized delta-60 repeat protein